VVLHRYARRRIGSGPFGGAGPGLREEYEDWLKDKGGSKEDGHDGLERVRVPQARGIALAPGD